MPNACGYIGLHIKKKGVRHRESWRGKNTDQQVMEQHYGR